jgi:hypothetical protein
MENNPDFSCHHWIKERDDNRTNIQLGWNRNMGEKPERDESMEWIRYGRLEVRELFRKGMVIE